MGKNWSYECSSEREKVKRKEFISCFQNAELRYFHFRQVISLLTDLVYFLASHEGNGSDPFDVQILKPNRERQKLVREQNILKQVCRND